MVHLVFVYGTLKHGQRNHHLLQDEVYAGTKATRDPIYLMEQFESATSPGKYTPGVRKVDHGGRISGEIYAVDDTTLAKLDELEGVGVKYDREEIMLNGGVKAWMYLRRGVGQEKSPHITHLPTNNAYMWFENPAP